ncbi:hypothetical protein CDL12_25539 [Handroanthus impetiginosus]|uniref:Rapid ALkalinization Factor n=1 Tax=Handroanthus impetiginosus TaxID=429701 RepID=A0A2G9G9Q2_9LAMI|nr:hypothetical protein CDL12_25539 [Handroanthus impetiginosus]
MEKVHTKQHPFLLVLMLLFLTIIAQKGAKSLPTGAALKALDGCNATRIGDCMTDDEEFLMESETSRRVLAAGRNSITTGSLIQGRPFCNRNVYGSCVPEPSKYYERPCTYQNLCRRGGT